jgi:hypothetical protein
MNAKAIDGAVRLIGIDQIWPLLEETVAGLQGFEYHLLSVERFGEILRTSESEGCRAYWYDIVQRAHLGAVSGLLRQHRWLHGAITATAGPNFHVFASCMRGFLESAADIWHGLNLVAKTLAVEFSTLRAALAGETLHFSVCQELEDRLVHFQFAARLPGKTLGADLEQPKKQREYLTHLQGASDGPLHDWYGELCDITHPGASSLFAFTRGSPELTGTWYRIDNALDEKLIETHCRRHASLIVWAVQRAVNLPLLTLKTINELPAPEFHSSVLDGIDLDNIAAWRFIKQQIAHARGSIR